MNLLDLFVKIGVKDEASDKVGAIASKLGSGLKAAAAVGVAAVGTAATGIGALTKTALDNYAEYEQYIGGTQLLFGDAADFVQERAKQAYKNVQISQNQYLKTANGFATGLKTALNGNAKAAAELADRIITAEADVVAATGASQEAVENAFNGIMKSNFTMIDNLQLGITPTKEGFQEMIDKVNEWKAANGDATRYQMGNLADMQSALIDYIDMQGLAGYAAAEASKTISGSVASMKAAWTNLVTGIADENADLDELIDDFLESVETVAGNIFPVVQRVFTNIWNYADENIPLLLAKIPSFVSEYLPKVFDAGTSILQKLIDGFWDEDNQEQAKKLGSAIKQIITKLGAFFTENAGDILAAGVYIFGQIVLGILKLIPDAVKGIPKVVKDIVNEFIEHKDEFVELGKEIGKAFIDAFKNPDFETNWISKWLVEKFVNAHDPIFEDRLLPKKSGGGSFASGLSYVPRNEYRATLHQGEMVLTEKQADDYRAGQRTNEPAYSRDDTPVEVVLQVGEYEFGRMVFNLNKEREYINGYSAVEGV